MNYIGKRVKTFFSFRHGRFGNESDSSEIVGIVEWQHGDCIHIKVEKVLWGIYNSYKATIYISKSEIEIIN